MMRRDLNGKVDGEGIKRGDATEFGVTLLAPIVIGRVTVPKAPPNTLKSLGALPETNTTPLAGHSIEDINPNYGSLGRTENCVNCTIATDSTLANRPASALPSNNPVAISELENIYNGKFVSMSQNSIEQEILKAGNGARGIVYGEIVPGRPGHVFNVVNQKGVVRFLDGQTGKPARLTEFNRFKLLRTN